MRLETKFDAADAFDEDFYRKTYSRPIKHNISPLADFVEFGAAEGRDPNPLFDSSIYLDWHPDVRNSGMDPLTHFLRVGANLGWNPHILIDMPYLLDQCRQMTNMLPVQVYLSYLRGLLPPEVNPHPMFDGKYYQQLFTLRTKMEIPTNISFLSHYLTAGYKLYVDPHPLFSERHYSNLVPGLHEVPTAGLRHYVEFGISEGRSPHPFVVGDSYRKDGVSGSGPFHPQEIPNFAALNSDRLPPASSGAAALARWYNLEASNAIKCADKPIVSFIILNYNKSYLTLQTLASLALHTDTSAHEIIVLDNGSATEDFFQLISFLPPAVRVVRLKANRFFGDGNNIAVEHARGGLICLLNNDLCFTDKWLDHMLDEFNRNDGKVAVGPLFKFPNGELQEFGGIVSACGQVIQRYKHLRNYPESNFPKVEHTDYSSAACFLLSKELFLKIGGFDYRYEPAYYEDTDLCMKINLSGHSIRVVSQSVVYHIENSTNSEPALLGGRMNEIIPINRYRFVGRWHAYMSRNERGAPDSDREQFVGELISPSFKSDIGPRKPARTSPRLALYNPYPLIVGGGERYLLSAGAAWAKKTGGEVSVVTPDRYSRLRILTLLRDLGICAFPFQCVSLDEADGQFDLSIVMGNEVLPPIAGFAKENIFHCQFPFPHTPEQVARSFAYLSQYRLVIVNSEFTKAHYLRALRDLNLPSLPVEVVYPPVPLPRKTVPPKGGGLTILSVGRFFVGGHTKGHAVLIAAFKALLAHIPDAELHLAGGLQPGVEHQHYLADLEEMGRGLPVYFHINVEPWQLNKLYEKAHFYWHGTGLQSRDLSPEKYEHFGITIVEAMAHGCVPFALDRAGPAEIIEDGKSGMLVRDGFDLVERAIQVVEKKAACLRMAQHAIDRAQRYSEQIFNDRITNILDFSEKNINTRSQSQQRTFRK